MASTCLPTEHMCARMSFYTHTVNYGIVAVNAALACTMYVTICLSGCGYCVRKRTSPVAVQVFNGCCAGALMDLRGKNYIIQRLISEAGLPTDHDRVWVHDRHIVLSPAGYRAVELVFPESAIQLCAGYSQPFGRSHFVAVGFAQGLFNSLSLEAP